MHISLKSFTTILIRTGSEKSEPRIDELSVNSCTTEAYFHGFSSAENVHLWPYLVCRNIGAPKLIYHHFTVEQILFLLWMFIDEGSRHLDEGFRYLDEGFRDLDFKPLNHALMIRNRGLHERIQTGYKKHIKETRTTADYHQSIDRHDFIQSVKVDLTRIFINPPTLSPHLTLTLGKASVDALCTISRPEMYTKVFIFHLLIAGEHQSLWMTIWGIFRLSLQMSLQSLHHPTHSDQRGSGREEWSSDTEWRNREVFGHLRKCWYYDHPQRRCGFRWLQVYQNRRREGFIGQDIETGTCAWSARQGWLQTR